MLAYGTRLQTNPKDKSQGSVSQRQETSLFLCGGVKNTDPSADTPSQSVPTLRRTVRLPGPGVSTPNCKGLRLLTARA
eukprot:359816-Chlamydomonas_euryale.AAC.3